MNKISILIGILILVMLITISFLLFLFNQVPKSQKSNLQTDNQTQTEHWFEIKEVNVKFKLTDDIKDLVYSVKYGQLGETDKYIDFSTHSLQEQGGKDCTVGWDDFGIGPIGSIKFSSADPYVPGGPEYRYLIKSDDFYITYTSPQSTCSDNPKVNQLQTKQIKSLKDALKTIIKSS